MKGRSLVSKKSKSVVAKYNHPVRKFTAHRKSKNILSKRKEAASKSDGLHILYIGREKY